MVHVESDLAALAVHQIKTGLPCPVVVLFTPESASILLTRYRINPLAQRHLAGEQPVRTRRFAAFSQPLQQQQWRCRPKGTK